jgi:hypothetical protein
MSLISDKESSCSEMPQYAANPYVRVPNPVLSLLPNSTSGNRTHTNIQNVVTKIC